MGQKIFTAVPVGRDCHGRRGGGSGAPNSTRPSSILDRVYGRLDVVHAREGSWRSSRHVPRWVIERDDAIARAFTRRRSIAPHPQTRAHSPDHQSIGVGGSSTGARLTWRQPSRTQPSPPGHAWLRFGTGTGGVRSARRSTTRAFPRVTDHQGPEGFRRYPTVLFGGW